MKSYKVVEFGQPLQRIEEPTPTPTGTQVLVRITAAGVCHSDVHLWEGYFDMGGGNKYSTQKTMNPPRTMGHEIVGEVVALGPDAKGATVGQKAVVYPWIGCGSCWYCNSGIEHLCPSPRALGVNADGGYADHVLVPHAKYLFDYTGVPTELACLYACSGITAFGAVKKAQGNDGGKPVLVIGAGGVGLMGVQFARVVLGRDPIVADIDPRKRELALQQGACAAIDPRDANARKQVMELTGGTGVGAALDFVGAESTAQFGQRVLARGGRLIIVGLFGGTFSTPLPMFAFTGAQFIGSVTGSPAEMAEMMALVRAGKVTPVPLTTRKLDDADAALQDLRKGVIMGRAVLVP
ncbi:zinc-binding dehydrogenase [Vineibacter terrae]|uniref:Zinc-binding dehydrogenase n=1 Tax=Vineibacter terrae TaxID=2586908 RepID=A0A5C8PHH8_9HYPH|nr:alcohol dehydrogenase [Vineibacter terrae]TXL73115.1 zinc-binding dehydrogenase [Vineibacter terrae]